MSRFVSIICLGYLMLYKVQDVTAWISSIRTNTIYNNVYKNNLQRIESSSTSSSPYKRTTTSAIYTLSAPSYDNSNSVNNNNNNNSNQNTNSGDINNNNNEIVMGGRILEGGKVIDFSSVKASCKAETALAEARQIVLQQLQQSQQSQSQSSQHSNIQTNDSILGINQDVIDQVGHELGTFCSYEDVQECATYLRSIAPIGLFTTHHQPSTSNQNYEIQYNNYMQQSSSSNNNNNNNNNNIQRYESIIGQAYDEAGEVTSAFAKTFYMGTMLMSEHARRAIWAVYVWCRRTDEIVDAPRSNDENGNNEMLIDLSKWELRLEQLWEYGTVVDVYDLCLLHTRIKYPTMDIQPFMDMIRGMLMDVPELGVERYNTFDELHLYCYRVAGTVGVMSLPVFGCAPGYDENIAREPALSLGVAFQLTNILRDVGEDAKQRGRIYLPLDDMKRFGVSEEQIFEQRMDDNYRSMMKYQIDRARMYYERARRGVFMLAEESRLPVQTSLDAYGRILDKIEENNYDSLTRRAYVDKWEKLSIIPFSWYRTTDLSRTLPLPGDKPVDLSLA